MKYFMAVFIGYLWCVGMMLITVKTGIEPPSNDIQFLTTSIIVAGVIAGGEG